MLHFSRHVSSPNGSRNMTVISVHSSGQHWSYDLNPTEHFLNDVDKNVYILNKRPKSAGPFSHY